MSGEIAGISVRGAATPDEVAAILAALAQRRAAPVVAGARGSGYVRWRRTRLAALRASG